MSCVRVRDLWGARSMSSSRQHMILLRFTCDRLGCRCIGVRADVGSHVVRRFWCRAVQVRRRQNTVQQSRCGCMGCQNTAQSGACQRGECVQRTYGKRVVSDLYLQLIAFEDIDAALTDQITAPSSVLTKPKVPSGEVRSEAAASWQPRTVMYWSSTFSPSIICRTGCRSRRPRVGLHSEESPSVSPSPFSPLSPLCRCCCLHSPRASTFRLRRFSRPYERLIASL